ncbi:MAG: response regulator [Verrucomicrobia bacterium]|nr:response regulator [Verrucomicrobiota bacterium]
MNHKILLVDDDQDLLVMYREILSKLPSQPEIHTAASGARALALLEDEPFTLLICDLKMPKMDGLQVLSIVRRKHPQLRTVVLTAIMDEQFRSRVYALGVDQFWQKPGTEQEIKLFLDCLESLLGREAQSGFRGMQSKSLVDILQLECLSQSSAVLKISNGPQTARIWIQNGELIDATTDDLTGEPAFRAILAWKTGLFETLAAEPARPRTIFNSYQALLLETAQAFDESKAHDTEVITSSATPAGPDATPVSPLAALMRRHGVEFALETNHTDPKQFEAHGLENPQPMADWARQMMDRLTSLGDRLRAGQLNQVECLGPQRHVAIVPRGNAELCIGWNHNMSGGKIRETMKKILNQWAS